MSEPSVYRASVWEADDGWHWRVDENGCAQNGVMPTRIFAFYMIVERLAAIERGDWPGGPVRLPLVMMPDLT